jgi:hypothetical protein
MDLFIDFFDLMGSNLLRIIEQSRLVGRISIGINATFIALIPKKSNPKTFSDFWSILLCNVDAGAS